MSALGDQSTDAANHPTLHEHSTSSQQSAVPVIVSDLKKSDDSNRVKHASLDQLSTDSLGQLSFVASHVTVNFSDYSNIIPAHSRPVAKKEQLKFEFTITNISNINGMMPLKSSCENRIANLRWTVVVTAECVKDDKYFYVHICCPSECPNNLWSCDTDIKFQLISTNPETNPLVRKTSHKFAYKSSVVRICQLDWSKLMDHQNGYVNNDEVTIEVEVTIKKIIGFREFSEFDFVSDGPGSNSHVVLIVQGERINICKHYLSVYSPVFHAMFFSEFIERDKKEIVLEDVESSEFLELLHVIYPTHKPVTEHNVEFLLKLGDRFEVQFVTNECERFLLGSTGVSTAKKLIYSDKYRFAKLQDVCMKTIKDKADVKALMDLPEYSQFTNETKAAILEHLVK